MPSRREGIAARYGSMRRSISRRLSRPRLFYRPLPARGLVGGFSSNPVSDESARIRSKALRQPSRVGRPPSLPHPKPYSSQKDAGWQERAGPAHACPSPPSTKHSVLRHAACCTTRLGICNSVSTTKLRAVGRMNPPRVSAACSVAVGLIFPVPLTGGKFCTPPGRRSVASQNNGDSTLEGESRRIGFCAP
jgi:hypothetical protein